MPLFQPPVFSIDDFIATFSKFSDEAKYSRAYIQMAGTRAMSHIKPFSRENIPLQGWDRTYAIFLMAAHLIELDDLAKNASGDGAPAMSGTPFKATVGTVTVETTKQNTFNNDDWNYWLNQTAYGRELLALLDANCVGIFTNTPCDTVRDLL